MALTPDDLIEPKGRLQAALFPGLDLTVLLTGWLQAAGGKMGGIAGNAVDAATTAYVYHLAYSHVADRLAASPNSVSIDSAASVQQQVGQDRIAYFARLAQRYLDEYENYISSPANPERPRSGYVRNWAEF